MSVLDDLIGWLSPAAAANRARARYALQLWNDARASYDGAAKTHRTRFWKRPGTSANAEVGPALPTLRNGARELVRNNDLAARARQVIPASIVGTGILPETATDNDRIKKRYEDLARAHLDTTACDADGQHNLYGLQDLAVGTMFEAGEVLVRRRRRRAADGLPVPVQFQVLEPDFLDDRRDGPMPNGNFAVQGVEFDAIGRRVAYWLFTQHPGDATWRRAPDSVRVPADDVIHLYRVDRPGQVRGVTWMAPIMLGLKDFAEYRDAQLVRQKIAACYVVVETDMFTDDALGAGGTTGAIAGQSSQNENRQTGIEPGMHLKLGPGRDVKFGTPPGVTGYREYTVEEKHNFAAALGITYQTLSGDLREVNFSSGRMGWLQEQRNIQRWQDLTVIPRLCEPLWRWFVEAAVLVAPLPRVGAIWTPPAREMIDPTKEGPAERDMIRAGLKTPSDVLRARGKDPDKHWSEYARDMELVEKLGLVLDSDPRSTTRAGSAMASGGPAPADGSESAADAPQTDDTTGD